MGLFGDKVEVGLALDATEVVAGHAVVARVRLGAPDKRSQGARVELLYRNTYRYETTDSDGDRTTSSRTVDVTVASVPLALQPGEVAVQLHVPPTAPGTALKSVEWLVRAVVDRKMGSDAKAEQPLFVRAPAAPLASWVAAPVVCGPECAFQIDVSSRYALPGQQLTGTVTVTPAAPISARALKLRLRRIRYDQDGETLDEVAQEVVLAQGVELAGGATWQAPFAMTVPPDAPPSFEAHHNRQRWFLDAVLDRKMKKDVEGRLQILVHTI